MILQKDTLLAVIDDIRERIASGDSLEGSFEYLSPKNSNEIGFEVKTSYRIGNLQSQGGLRIIP